MKYSVNGKYVKPVTRKDKYLVLKENDNNLLLETEHGKEWFPKLLCKPVYWCVDCQHLKESHCQLQDIEKPFQYNASCEFLELKKIKEVSQKPESWNPDHFGDIPFVAEPDGQLTIFQEEVNEPPDPDDYPCFEAYEEAWREWEVREQEVREQLDNTNVVREQEVREQLDNTNVVREQEVREQLDNTNVVREQQVREQQSGDRRLKCSLTPHEKIINKANSKGLKGTFDLKEIKHNFYWYIRFREDGKLRSVYLGKAITQVREQND